MRPGFAARLGAALGEASAARLTAQTRLAQRIGCRRQLSLEVELDRLAVRPRSLTDRLGAGERRKVGDASGVQTAR